MGLTRRKKKYTHSNTLKGLKKPGPGQKAAPVLPDDRNKSPACFIIGRGHLPLPLQDLVNDLKSLFEPNTATKLKHSKRNVLKDFLAMAGPLSVSHCIVVTFKGESPVIRMAKFPHGPTLTFKISGYSLCKDVKASQKRPRAPPNLHLTSPLLILSQFSEKLMKTHEKKSLASTPQAVSSESNVATSMKLISTFIKNMLPSVNVHNVILSQIRRCILFHYQANTNSFQLRHYYIRASPVGTSKQVDRLLRRKVPSLSKYNDISDYVLRENLSESEAEDLPEAQVSLPQNLPGAGNIASCTSRIRLYELGPRLNLTLFKIEEGLFEGEVLHHAYITRTTDEIFDQRNLLAKKQSEKALRRKLQDANVRRKAAERLEHRRKTLAGMRNKGTPTYPPSGINDATGVDDDDDDDFKYYEDEVGITPDKDLLLPRAKKPKMSENLKTNKRNLHSIDSNLKRFNKKTNTKNRNDKNNIYPTKYKNRPKKQLNRFQKNPQKRKIKGGTVFRVRNNTNS